MIRRLALAFLFSGVLAPVQALDTDWPALTRESRPWAYWWWPGSAVTEKELTRQLEYHRQAGMGGLHIVPIYGVKGYEAQYIPYLSPRWMEMLAYTLREADRLGLGIDMTLGTGWPYGGPWVDPPHAARHVFLEVLVPTREAELSIRCATQPDAPCEALVAVSASGKRLDLLSKVDAGGRLRWQPPAGDWKIYALYDGWTRQQVKRAAPGDEGNVMDFFSRASLDAYLKPYAAAFKDHPGVRPRAFYNDSYEVYGANWTPRLPEEFRKRRGYDLCEHLPALAGQGDPDTVARVKSDYRETVSDLLDDEFTRPWVAWCHAQGTVVRNQAHGSPGNLIDLYAAADIPETEGFGEKGADILLSNLASSAAHLYDRRLVSSETFTWLREHFRESPDDIRAALDTYFLSGINHVFYHGIPYSPADAPFPGWLFYASTHFGESNTISPQLPGLHQLVARCQAFLQLGQSDNNVLLYIPYYDLLAVDHGSSDDLQFCTIHNVNHWLKTNLETTYDTAMALWARGYTFDYVSDRELSRLSRKQSAGRYRAVVVAGCRRMPQETLEALARLAGKGTAVLCAGGLPCTVPGWKDWTQREARLRRRVEELRDERVFRTGDDAAALLAAAGVERETLVDGGLEFVRRRDGDSVIYFLANRTDEHFDGWLPLAASGQSAVLFDPLHGTSGVGAVRHDPSGRLEVGLQLGAGQSMLLRALPRPAAGAAWVYQREMEPVALGAETWRVEFLRGGPKLPAAWTTSTLWSWTEAPDPAARDFSGTARYQTTFSARSTPADGWLLDMGDVQSTARVYINDQMVGDVWCHPFRLDVGGALHAGRNSLRVDVSNLMANRVAAMDRAQVPWQKFFFVNINYRSFDASRWRPLPSGLLGPVRLIPFERLVRP